MFLETTQTKSIKRTVPATMRSILYLGALLLISAACVPGSAQVFQGIPNPPRMTRDQLAQILKNSKKLQVSLKLDWDVYFTGEEPNAAITVQNSTPVVLEVLDPLQMGALNLLVRDPSRLKSWGTEWMHLVAEPRGGHEIGLDAPSRFMNPGEKLQIDYSSPEGCMNKTMDWGWANCYLPEKEGEYRLEFTYVSLVAAQFRIVWPQLEQWTKVVLQKPLEIPDTDGNRKPTGKMLVSKPRVRAVVLGYQSNHILAVSVEDFSGDPRIRFDPNGAFTGYVSRHFGVLRRLVTSSKAITALQATADAAENITISYTEDGQRFTLKLDPNRKLIPNP